MSRDPWNSPIHRDALSLEDFGISSKLSILVLAPHPDDFDEIGVTMRYLKDNGNAIHVAVATSGASGVEDSFCDPPTVENKMAIREKEQRASCRFFGLPRSQLSFLRLKEDNNGHPYESQKNIDCISRHFLKHRADFVFLPHGNDTNIGHQRIYAMFRTAAEQAGYPLVAFLNRDPKTIRMRHDVFLCFDESEAEWKRQLLRYHQSQHQRNLNQRGYGLDKRILMVNRQIAKACDVDVPYAEAFELEIFGGSRSMKFLGPFFHQREV